MKFLLLAAIQTLTTTGTFVFLGYISSGFDSKIAAVGGLIGFTFAILDLKFSDKIDNLEKQIVELKKIIEQK